MAAINWIRQALNAYPVITGPITLKMRELYGSFPNVDSIVYNGQIVFDSAFLNNARPQEIAAELIRLTGEVQAKPAAENTMARNRFLSEQAGLLDNEALRRINEEFAETEVPSAQEVPQIVEPQPESLPVTELRPDIVFVNDRNYNQEVLNWSRQPVNRNKLAMLIFYNAQRIEDLPIEIQVAASRLEGVKGFLVAEQGSDWLHRQFKASLHHRIKTYELQFFRNGLRVGTY